ncbi:MAG: hypothetical protein HY606_03485 [Planctomycetes bacterium]|nr:hypothetical protein [Planctomycetota bacterium]
MVANPQHKSGAKSVSINDFLRTLSTISLFIAIVSFVAGAVLLYTSKVTNDRMTFTSGMLIGLSCAQSVMWGLLNSLNKLLKNK